MKYLSLLLLSIMFTQVASAQKREFTKAEEKAIMDSAGVTQEDISVALKETLQKGAEEGAKELSKKKAFRSNSLFGLDIPPELQKLAEVLKAAGETDLLEEFEKFLNRSAAGISTGASDVFGQAIGQVSFADAFRILMAGENAATRYLESQAGPGIENAMKPLVEKALISSGAMDKWSAILTAYNKETGQNINFNLVEYITSEAVDEMFDTMAAEEAKIRLNQYFWGSLIMKKVMSIAWKIPR